MTSLYSKPHPVGHFEDLTEEAHPKLFHVKVVHPEIQHWTHCYWSESESAACYYFTDDNAWQMLSLELYIVLSLRECQIVLQSTQELPNKRATDVKLWFHLQTFILRQHNRWSRQISTLANMFCFVLEEGQFEGFGFEQLGVASISPVKVSKCSFESLIAWSVTSESTYHLHLIMMMMTSCPMRIWGLWRWWRRWGWWGWWEWW